MSRLSIPTLWITVVATEMALTQAWLAVLLAVFGPVDWRAALPSLPLLAGLYVAGVLYSRYTGTWLQNSPIRGHLQAGTGLAVVAAATILVHLLWAGSLDGLLRFSPTIYTVLGAIYLWRQGTDAGVRGLAFSGVAAGFPTRAFLMVLAILFGSWMIKSQYAVPELMPLLYRLIVLFFAVGLAAQALARVLHVRLWQISVGESMEAERVSPFLVALALVTVAVGVGLDALGPGGALEPLGVMLGQALGAVGRALDALLRVVLYPILAAVGWLIQWIKSQMYRGPNIEDVGDGEVAPPEHPPLELPGIDEELVFRILKVAGLALGLLIAYLVLVRVRKRPAQHGTQVGAVEVRESLGVLHGLWADLVALCRWIWQKLFGRLRRGQPSSGTAAEQAGADLAAAPPAVRDIRQAFRRLQELGARLGRRRRPSETPLAYGDALDPMIRIAAAGPAARLAGLYSRVRYGGRPPEPDEVEAARAALQQVETAVRQAGRDGAA